MSFQSRVYNDNIAIDFARHQKSSFLLECKYSAVLWLRKVVSNNIRYFNFQNVFKTFRSPLLQISKTFNIDDSEQKITVKSSQNKTFSCRNINFFIVFKN